MPSIDSGQNGSRTWAIVPHSPPWAGRVDSEWMVAIPLHVADRAEAIVRAREAGMGRA